VLLLIGREGVIIVNKKRFWCTQCWGNNLASDGKVIIAKGRKVTRYRCRDCGHRSFRRVDSYTDRRVLGNLLGFYKEGLALDEPYLSLAKALDAECQRKGGIDSREDWLRIIDKVLKAKVNRFGPREEGT
jgi:DNA-directed RNA polymerase subunit RPC12/RpoP